MNVIGNYLNENEKQDLLTSIGKQRKFFEVIATMKQHTSVDFNADSVKLENALKFDVEQKGAVFTAKVVDLVFDDNVKIHYITRYKDGDINGTWNTFIGSIKTNEANPEVNVNKIFRTFEDEIKVTEVSKEEIELANVQDDNFLRGLTLDENYVPGQLLEQVNSEGFTDGCMPGGYIFCGGNCGGYPACDKPGNGVNKLDTLCCKVHDCCYHYVGNTGSQKKSCDDHICSCAANYLGDYAGAYMVVAVFCI